MATEYDAIVIGAGPAGSTAAMYLGKAGKNVLLVDMAKFPRDKVCGDAQGRRAASIMKELGIYEGYTQIPGKGIYGTNEQGQPEEIRAKVVLAADGANSTVAAKFGLNKNPLEHSIVAIS